jgi:hypothetical protein
MNAAPLEVLGKQIKYGFIMVVGLIIGVQFINNKKFDEINANLNANFKSIENSLEYIKARVDEHTFYDSSRISVLKSVTSQYIICDGNSVLHFVQFQHNNQILRGGITVAHSFCASEVPDKHVFDCETLDIAIVPICPPKGIITY